MIGRKDIRRLLGKIVQRVSYGFKRFRRLSIAVAGYRKLRFFPGGLKLGAWRVDYGPHFYLVFADKIEVPLEKLSFDDRALAEMRSVIESKTPTPQLADLLRDRFGPNFDTTKTPLYFARWKSLIEVRGEFTVCATVSSSGELSVIDGAHRVAIAVLSRRSSIAVVLGVRRNSKLATLICRFNGAVNHKSLENQFYG